MNDAPTHAYALTVEYDGSDFSGWQRQPGRRTVEGVLAAALGAVTRETPRLSAAGRTDAKAHAHGQVVAVHLHRRWEPKRLVAAVDAWLPADVTVVDGREVHLGFHPRFHALSRSYRYLVAPRRWRTAVTRRYAWAVSCALDVEAMRRAGTQLVGRHDFAAFGRAPRPGGTTVRTVSRVDVSVLALASTTALVAPARGRYLVIEVEADAFLYGMMRAIAGTLVAVGAGRLSPADVAAILIQGEAARRRVTVAPAWGLHQWRVTYREGVEVETGA